MHRSFDGHKTGMGLFPPPNKTHHAFALKISFIIDLLKETCVADSTVICQRQGAGIKYSPYPGTFKSPPILQASGQDNWSSSNLFPDEGILSAC